jgi:hypothetical protein
MRFTHSFLATAVLALLSVPAWSASADGQGLRSRAGETERWPGRLSLVVRTAADWPVGRSTSQFATSTQPASVTANYYFITPKPSAPANGFRASAGLGLGRLGTTWVGTFPLGFNGSSMRYRDAGASTSLPGDSPRDTHSVPYLSVGYTGAYAKSGWGFSADFGLIGVARSADSTNGASLEGGASAVQPGTDALFQQMRLRPLLQLGVTYSF